MSSGRVPRPVRQNRCLSRASSSRGWNGDEAEVVEQVVAQLEVAELGAADEQEQQGSSGRSRLRMRPAQGEGALGVDVGARRWRPAQPSSGSLRSTAASSRDRLPRVAAEVERLGQLRRRRDRG